MCCRVLIRLSSGIIHGIALPKQTTQIVATAKATQYDTNWKGHRDHDCSQESAKWHRCHAEEVARIGPLPCQEHLVLSVRIKAFSKFKVEFRMLWGCHSKALGAKEFPRLPRLSNSNVCGARGPPIPVKVTGMATWRNARLSKWFLGNQHQVGSFRNTKCPHIVLAFINLGEGPIPALV